MTVVTTAMPTGFVDLPAELRNIVYDNITASAWFHERDIFSFASTCRMVRAEFLTLELPSFSRLITQIQNIDAALEVFFSSHPVSMLRYNHSLFKGIFIIMDRMDTSATIDLARIASIVRAPYNNFKVIFSGGTYWHRESVELNALVDKMTTKKGWDDALENFVSITLIAKERRPGTKLKSGRRTVQESWVIKLVCKSGVIPAWDHNDKMRRRQTRDLLAGLGLRKLSACSCYRSSVNDKGVFKALKIIVAREDGEVSKEGVHTMYW